MKLRIGGNEVTLNYDNQIALERYNPASNNQGSFSIPLNLPKDDNQSLLGFPGRTTRKGDIETPRFEYLSGNSELLEGTVAFGEITDDTIEIILESDEKELANFYANKHLDEVYYDPVTVEDDLGDTPGCLVTYHKHNAEAESNKDIPFVVCPFMINSTVRNTEGEDEEKIIVINNITMKTPNNDPVYKDDYSWPPSWINYNLPSDYSSDLYRFLMSYGIDNYGTDEFPEEDDPWIENVSDQGLSMCLQFRLFWIMEQLLKQAGWAVVQNDIKDDAYYSRFLIYGKLFNGILTNDDSEEPGLSNISRLLPHYDAIDFLENAKNLCGVAFYFKAAAREVSIRFRNTVLVNTPITLFNSRKLKGAIFKEPERKGYRIQFGQQNDEDEQNGCNEYLFNPQYEADNFEEIDYWKLLSDGNLVSDEFKDALRKWTGARSLLDPFIVKVNSRNNYYFLKRIPDPENEGYYLWRWREYARLKPWSKNLIYSDAGKITGEKDGAEEISLDFIVPQMKAFMNTSEVSILNIWGIIDIDKTVSEKALVPFVNMHASDYGDKLVLSKLTYGLYWDTTIEFPVLSGVDSYTGCMPIAGLITQRYLENGLDIVSSPMAYFISEMKFYFSRNSNKLGTEIPEITINRLMERQQRFLDFLHYHSMLCKIPVEMASIEAVRLDFGYRYLIGDQLFYIDSIETEEGTDGETETLLYCLLNKDVDDESDESGSGA